MEGFYTFDYKLELEPMLEEQRLSELTDKYGNETTKKENFCR